MAYQVPLQYLGRLSSWTSSRSEGLNILRNAAGRVTAMSFSNAFSRMHLARQITQCQARSHIFSSILMSPLAYHTPHLMITTSFIQIFTSVCSHTFLFNPSSAISTRCTESSASLVALYVEGSLRQLSLSSLVTL